MRRMLAAARKTVTSHRLPQKPKKATRHHRDNQRRESSKMPAAAELRPQWLSDEEETEGKREREREREKEREREVPLSSLCHSFLDIRCASTILSDVCTQIREALYLLYLAFSNLQLVVALAVGLVATPDYPVAAGQKVDLHCRAFTIPVSFMWSWQRMENQTWQDVGTDRDMMTLTKPEQSGLYRCRGKSNFTQMSMVFLDLKSHQINYRIQNAVEGHKNQSELMSVVQCLKSLLVPVYVAPALCDLQHCQCPEALNDMGPGDCPVSVDADGPEEEDGAVGVDEEQRTSQPAHEVCVDPVAMPTVIVNPEGKGTDKKEISDGQVCHVDADFAHGLGFTEAAQHKQHIEVSEEAQDEDDAIDNREKD
ncbi:hypothetical protein FQN60_008827, partial [Etheostoma spectabile]